MHVKLSEDIWGYIVNIMIQRRQALQLVRLSSCSKKLNTIVNLKISKKALVAMRKKCLICSGKTIMTSPFNGDERMCQLCIKSRTSEVGYLLQKQVLEKYPISKVKLQRLVDSGKVKVVYYHRKKYSCYFHAIADLDREINIMFTSPEAYDDARQKKENAKLRGQIASVTREANKRNKVFERENERQREVEDALRKRGLELRSDSTLCNAYIDGRSRFDLDEIVEMMVEAHILWQHTSYNGRDDFEMRDQFLNRFYNAKESCRVPVSCTCGYDYKLK
eukprot:NODE_341_length_10628_cov_0.466996.p3 type:complete len:277 gc:universal NODE_341_length_10628_cov_0.466996:1014-1844(+)